MEAIGFDARVLEDEAALSGAHVVLHLLVEGKGRAFWAQCPFLFWFKLAGLGEGVRSCHDSNAGSLRTNGSGHQWRR